MQTSFTVTRVDMAEEAPIEDRIKVYQQALETMCPVTDRVWVKRYRSLINKLQQEIDNG